ncbi:DUF2345 domain-containing protein, partial [Zestomonas carbonaria]
AQQGELLMQAQHNDIKVQADQSVEISASRQHIRLDASKHITLLCGGAYIKIADGNIEMGMPGEFTVKASQHGFVGPAQIAPSLPDFPDTTTSPLKKTMRVSLGALPGFLSNYAGEPYRLLADDALLETGTLDEQGQLKWEHRDGTQKYTLELLTGQRFELDAQERFSEDADTGQVQKLSNQGYRSLPSTADGLQHGGDAFRALQALFKSI